MSRAGTGNKGTDTAVQELERGVARLQQHLGFDLKMAQSAVQREFAEALEGLGISQRVHAVLWLIASCTHPSQRQIASALQIDRATMMTIIDRLEGQQLLTRVRAEADRRRQELSLTAKGHKVLQRAEERVHRFEAALAARFSTGELEALRRSLRKLYATDAQSSGKHSA